ncbi:MAG: hypothetical protein P1U88_06940 [Thalassobaculaceae bacterium]|nr:hypothetical protein [Thalassobaculaceae bacterium]
MPVFKVTRDALPATTVIDAAPLIEALAARIGGKFSFDTARATPSERRGLFSIAHAFLKGPVPDIFRSLHGVSPSLCLSITTVRRQKAQDSAQMVDWHLDLNFAGDMSPFLVSWTAIEDVGVDCAALDICVPNGAPLRLQTLLDEIKQRTDQQRRLSFHSDELDQLFGKDAWSSKPLVAPAGSGAVFDQWIMHRTQVLEAATRDRHSIEFRMVDIGNLPIYPKSNSAFYATLDAGGELDLFIQGPSGRVDLTAQQFDSVVGLNR